MSIRLLTAPDLQEYLAAVAVSSERTGRVLLVGETALLWDGLRRGVPAFELVADNADLREACASAAASRGIDVILESPADLVPLPEGYEDRHRPASVATIAGADASPGGGGGIDVAHFDPYGVAIRFIARGDEPDYQLVVTMLAEGWIVESELDRMLNDLLPRFTRETIQQDPAEFRRKYKGLKQIWRAARPGVIHRTTPV